MPLHYRAKEVPPDEDDDLYGRCLTCKTFVQVKRHETFLDIKRGLSYGLNQWEDCPYIECPNCKKLSSKDSMYSSQGYLGMGPKVYLTSKPPVGFIPTLPTVKE